jgi:hypothetical protein
MRWVGYLAYMEKVRNACKVSVTKPEGWRQHGRRILEWMKRVKPTRCYTMVY